MNQDLSNQTNSGPNSGSNDAILDTIRGARDALSVKRVFGDAYELDGATVIPAARVAGGAGGGGGEGTGEDASTGSGSGQGFGLRATPVGVYHFRDGELTWKPAVDVNRLVRGGQVLTGIVAVCLTLVFLRRK